MEVDVVVVVVWVERLVLTQTEARLGGPNLDFKLEGIDLKPSGRLVGDSAAIIDIADRSEEDGDRPDAREGQRSGDSLGRSLRPTTKGDFS